MKCVSQIEVVLSQSRIFFPVVVLYACYFFHVIFIYYWNWVSQITFICLTLSLIFTMHVYGTCYGIIGGGFWKTFLFQKYLKLSFILLIHPINIEFRVTWVKLFLITSVQVHVLIWAVTLIFVQCKSSHI